MSILTVTDVEKRFGLVTALAGTSLAVHANEIHGLIGPNGSGKSTLLHVIAGRTPPDAGSVRLAGRDITGDPPSRRARDGLSIKFQLARIYREQTAAENMLLAVQAKAGLVELVLSRSRQRLRPRIADLLERVGLADVRDRPAGELSHGQQQWLEIAMAMATDPKVLLLDEPTAGMSRQERIRTGEVIRGVSERCAVVIVEHDLDFIRELCDRIDVLHQGRSIASGTPAEIERNGQVADVYVTRA